MLLFNESGRDGHRGHANDHDHCCDYDYENVVVVVADFGH